MPREVGLIYLRKSIGGGSTSFAVHLFRAFQIAGIPVRMFRASRRPRPPVLLGGYSSVWVESLTPEELLELPRKMPTLLVAAESSKNLPPTPFNLIRELVGRGTRMVIHDPLEFTGRRGGIYDYLGPSSFTASARVLPGLSSENPFRGGDSVFCIRPTLKQFFPDATFIPHPYCRTFSGWVGSDLHHRKSACSLARVSFVKRPQLILRANRDLRSDEKIQFLGSENRVATFVLKKEYPEVRKMKFPGLPFTWGAGPMAVREFRLMVDLTFFPHDGGGSQYTFMEAWDAGAVVVVHRDWLRYPGEMREGENCLAVSSPEELAYLVRHVATSKALRAALKSISRNSVIHLEKEHDPASVARRYYHSLVADPRP